MFYIDKDNQTYPLSEADIQSLHPRFFMAHCLEQYAPVKPTPIPQHNPETQKPIEIAPLETDGVWRQQWSVVALSAEELEAIAAAKARAEQDARDAARVSVTKRQALLALFDLEGVREDSIIAVINAIEDDHIRYRTLVDWQGAATIDSDSATVVAIAGALGITERLPALFDYARVL